MPLNGWDGFNDPISSEIVAGGYLCHQQKVSHHADPLSYCPAFKLRYAGMWDFPD